MNTVIDDFPIVDRQLFWPALKVGRKYRTIDRTIVQSDFERPTGQPNAGDLQAALAPLRSVPSELTYRVIENVIARTFVHRAGSATVECWQSILPPVCVGETIHAIVEIEEVQPDWQANQAMVVLNVEVRTESGAGVLSYSACQKVEGCAQLDRAHKQPLRVPAAKDSTVQPASRAMAPSGLQARQLIRTAEDREQPNGRLGT